MLETEQKMIEILRILSENEKPMGSKFLAEKLQTKGYELGERAVRYHLKILDEKGFTKRIGYSGREITDLGFKELDKGLVYDQVNFIFSKFEENIYKTNFDFKTGVGDVVLNSSHLILEKDSCDVVKEVFDAGICVSKHGSVNKFIKDEKDYIEVKTVCGTTIDGVLLKNGVPTVPIYGGLIKVEDYAPVKFSHLISLKETSISPIEAFLAKGMTSVLDVARNGEGLIPANFRIIPSNAREKAKKIVKQLSKVGINGVLNIGESGEDVLGVSVQEGMSGIPIVGGISPFCAALENDKDVLINLSGEINSYNNLKPLLKSKKTILKKSKKKKIKPLETILYKSMNLMQKIDFDIEDHSGNLLTNISFIKESDLNESIEIMADLYKKNSGEISNYYSIVDNPNPRSEFNKGISTICSLSIDGILNKNGVMCTPKYGGLLEARKNPVFIELISYLGSSLDPHEIYIFKNMTSLTAEEGYPKLLASVKEVPYIAREETLKILDKISDLGIRIIKVGKPQEVMFNSILDKYSFGIVTGSGLNQIAAINENKIEVKAKSQEGLTCLNEMEKLV